MKNTQIKLQGEKKSVNKQCKIDLWDDIKYPDACVIKDSEGRGRRTEMIIKEIMAEKFPNLLKIVKPQIQNLSELQEEDI